MCATLSTPTSIWLAWRRCSSTTRTAPIAAWITRTIPGAGFQNYTTFSLWDTYRAENPLLTLLQPGRVDDMVQSLLAEYRESEQHTTPIWPLWGNETWCMIGYHSVAVIADAYLKGFRGFDAEAAYQAMRDTAMQDRNGSRATRTGLRGFQATRGSDFEDDRVFVRRLGPGANGRGAGPQGGRPDVLQARGQLPQLVRRHGHAFSAGAKPTAPGAVPL